MSGPLPQTIGSLDKLTTLQLTYNLNFAGPLPAEMGDMAALKYVYMYNNKISGSLPDELGNISTLQTLFLSSNQISGELPASLAGISGLSGIFLNNNNLSGCIPDEWSMPLCGKSVSLGGNTCLSNGADFSNFCSVGCVESTDPACAPGGNCTDGIENGLETGVDCGGPDCVACPDMAFTSIALNSGILSSGEEIILDFALTNNGGQSVAAYDIDFYFEYTAGGRDVPFGSGTLNTVLDPGVSTQSIQYFNLPNNLVADTYHIVGIVDEDDLLGDIDLSNNIFSFPITLGGCNDGVMNGDEEGIDCGGNCTPCYDLEFTSITLNSGSIGPGEQIILNYIITNQGGQDVNGFNLDFYLSATPDGPAIATFANGALGATISAGSPYSQIQYANLPASVTTGTYYIIGEVDDDNNYNETDETDNTFEFPITFGGCNDGVANGDELGIDCGGPDCPECHELVFEHVIIQEPVFGPIGPGQDLTYKLVVKNEGSQVINGFNLKAHISNEGFNGSVYEPILNLQSNESINPNQSYAMSFTWTLSSSMPDGGYWVVGEIDAPDDYHEYNENNNKLSSSFTVSHCEDGEMSGDETGVDCGGGCDACQYDLTNNFMSLVTDPMDVVPGSPIMVDYSFTNSGQIGIGSFSVKYFLLTEDITDPALLPSDFLASRVKDFSSSASIGEILSGEDYIDIPDTYAPGDYFLISYVDPNDFFNNEIDEGDNIVSIPMQLKGLDFEFTSISVPSGTVLNGQDVSIDHTLTNQGALPMQDFTFKYFLSSDDAYSIDDLEIGNMFNYWINSGIVINPGDAVSGTDLINIPADVVPGDYHLIGFVDPNDQFDETPFEGNNITSVPITIEQDPCNDGEENNGETGIDCGGPNCEACLPDLVTHYITTSNLIVDPNQGDLIEIMYEVSNEGNVGANYIVGIYLSEDDVLTEGERLASVPHFFVDGVTSLGEKTEEIVSVMIPADIDAGSYKIFVFADSNDLNTESNEDNNIASTDIFVTWGSCCNGVVDDTETGIDEGGPCGMPIENNWKNHYQDLYNGDIDREINTEAAVGTTAGQHQVTNLGSAAYSVPITLPPGINGMVPSISLNYNSHSKYSAELGLGWTLMATSRIARNSKDNYNHGEILATSHSDLDGLNIDGQQLYLDQGFYKTRVENFAQVHPMESAGNGPLWFKVLEKSGLIKEYGNTSDSRKLGNGGTVLEWRLSKCYDQYGNYIEYIYSQEGNEFIVDRIEYTKNPFNSDATPNIVQFIYDDRGDINLAYQNSEVTNMRKVLVNIEITDTESETYKNYSISYGNANSAGLSINSLLSEITETGSDGSSLNSTRFEYGQNEIPTEFVDDTGLPNIEDSFKRVADLNGDGIDDIAIITKDKDNDPYARFYFGQRSGKFRHIKNQYIFGGNGDDSKTFLEWLGDFLEFGIDILFSAMTGGFHSFYSGVTSTVPFSMGNTFQAIDLDGDSRSELVFYEACNKCNNQVIQVVSIDEAENVIIDNITVDNPQGKANNVIGFYTGDFDGDSKIDFLLRYFRISSDTKDQSFSLVASSRNHNRVDINSNAIPGLSFDKFWQSYINTGYFNDDRKSDVLFGNYGRNNKSLLCDISVDSDGNGTFVPFQNSGELAYPNYEHIVLTTGDFNGDGLTDVVTGSPECVYEIGYSDGTRFIRKPFFFEDEFKPLVNFSNYFRNYYQRRLDLLVASDFNNDGKDDILFHPNARLIPAPVGGVYSPSENKTYYYDQPRVEPVSLYYSTGQNFVRSQLIEGVQTQALMAVGDFNGDGMLDLSIDNRNLDKDEMPASTAAQFSEESDLVLINKRSRENLLEHVLDGFNNKVSFQYADLTHPQVFDPLTRSANFPINSYTPKLDVVWKMNVPTGIADEQTEISYKYYKAWFQREGGGFLGFGRVERTDPLNHLVTESRNALSTNSEMGRDINVLLPSVLDTYVNGEWVSEKIYHNSFIRLDENRFWIKPNGFAERNYFYNMKTFKRIEYDNIQYNHPIDLNSFAGNETRIYESIENLGGSTLILQEKEQIFSEFDGKGSYIVNKPTNLNSTFKRQGYADLKFSQSIAYNNEGKIHTQTSFADLDNSVSTTYSNYDAYGNPQTVEKSTAHTLTNYPVRSNQIVYDETGRFPKFVTNDLGQIEEYEYIAKWGKPITYNSIDGLMEQFAFDGFGRETTYTSPLTVITDKVYSWETGEDTHLYSVSNSTPGLSTVTKYFDSFAREVQSEFVDYNDEITKTKTSYDSRGNVSTSTNAHREGTPELTSEYVYDNLNRLEYVNHPTNDLNYSYEELNFGLRKITTTTEEGKTNSETYDAVGNLLHSTDAGAVTTSYTYNAVNKPVSVSIGGVPQSVITYDAYHRQNSLNDIGGAGTMEYCYNGFGEIIRQKDQKNNITEMSYDILGRIEQSVSYIHNGDLSDLCGEIVDVDMNIESTTDYMYVTDENVNGLNRLKSVTYDYTGTRQYKNTESYSYDSYNRPISKTEVLDKGNTDSERTFVHTYDSYNSNNQLLSYTYPSGLSVTNNYDTNGYLTSVIGHGGTVYTTNSTNHYGQITQSTYGNGLVCKKQFNDYGLPTRFWVENRSDIFDMEFDFNVQNGNMNWRKDKHMGNDVSSILKETFTYDDESWDRLKTISYSGPTSLSGDMVTIDYQSNGNIKSKSDVSENDYKYDSDKYYQVNKIEDVISNTTPQETIIYNAAQQPVSIAQVNGATMILQYGADNQRRYSELVESEAITKRYYLGDYEVQINSDGTEEKIHYLGNGVITIEEENGQRNNYYTHSDHLGSILSISDQQGNEYARQSFDAWGRKRNAVDWTYSNVNNYEQSWLYRGYTGHEMLPEFGLVNMNGRLYDNVIGRMLSPDNFAGHGGNSQGYNRYSYVLNNPLKFNDPSGENPILHATYGFFAGGMIGIAANALGADVKPGAMALLGAGIGVGIGYGIESGGIASLGSSSSNLIGSGIASMTFANSNFSANILPAIVSNLFSKLPEFETEPIALIVHNYSHLKEDEIRLQDENLTQLADYINSFNGSGFSSAEITINIELATIGAPTDFLKTGKNKLIKSIRNFPSELRKPLETAIWDFGVWHKEGHGAPRLHLDKVVETYNIVKEMINKKLPTSNIGKLNINVNVSIFKSNCIENYPCTEWRERHPPRKLSRVKLGFNGITRKV